VTNIRHIVPAVARENFGALAYIKMIYYLCPMPKPKKAPNAPVLHRFTEGLRPRLEALKDGAGHKTLTGLINAVLTAWADKQENKKP
jgi:hypothetical protein